MIERYSSRFIASKGHEDYQKKWKKLEKVEKNDETLERSETECQHEPKWGY